MCSFSEANVECNSQPGGCAPKEEGVSFFHLFIVNIVNNIPYSNDFKIAVQL